MPDAARSSPTAEPAPPATAFSSIVTSASMVVGARPRQLPIQRLDEAHVDQRCIEARGDFRGRGQRRAEHQQRKPLAPRGELRAADRQRAHVRGDRSARTLAARDSAPRRTGQRAGGVEHLAALVLIGRRHDRQIRYAAQVVKVVAALLGRAVAAGESRAIHRKDDRQVLQSHVVDQLIVAALQATSPGSPRPACKPSVASPAAR